MRTDRSPDRLGVVSAAAANGAAGTLFAWSVLLPALDAEFGVPAAELGVVFSSALVVFALAVLFTGPAVDRHGPRRSTAVAGVVSGGGLALGAVAPDVVVFYVGVGVVHGFGSGLAYLSCVTWASTGQGRQRARVLAVVVSAYAAGPMAAAPLGALGVDRWGWRVTVGIAAVLVTGVIVLGSRGMTGGPGPRHSGQASGDDAGVDSLALAALWLLFLAAVAPGLLAFAYGAQIAMERGVPATAAGLVVALMAAGNLAGRLVSAPLVNRAGLRVALTACVGLLALALAGLGWSTTTLVAVVGLTLLALEYGLVSALLPAATHQATGDAGFGTAYGRVFSSFGLAAIAGPALGAALHDGADGYARGFQVSLVSALLAAAALTLYLHRLGRDHA